LSRRNSSCSCYLGGGVDAVQPEWNEAEVEIKMLDEEVLEAFVAFGFQKSAWVEENVKFD
jgi:hypothetical protein